MPSPILPSKRVRAASNAMSPVIFGCCSVPAKSGKTSKRDAFGTVLSTKRSSIEDIVSSDRAKARQHAHVSSSLGASGKAVFRKGNADLGPPPQPRAPVRQGEPPTCKRSLKEAEKGTAFPKKLRDCEHKSPLFQPLGRGAGLRGRAGKMDLRFYRRFCRASAIFAWSMPADCQRTVRW